MKNCRTIFDRLTDDNGHNLNYELVGKIESAVNEQSNSAFDLAYSLIDTACKTIQSERNENDNQNDDLPKRFKSTLKLLNLVPLDYDTTKPNGIATTMRGLESAVRGLCELRNSDGIIAHGKPATTKSMDLLQIQFAAQTADLVVHYLYQAHFDYPMPTPEIMYGDNSEFNDYVDDIHPEVEIFGQTLLASQILFNADEQHVAYKEALLNYVIEAEENDD